MKPRKIIFWLHLFVGVTGGVLVLVMATTGIMLSLERPVVAWAEQGAYAIKPEPGTQRLGMEALLEKAESANPGLKPDAITIHASDALPAAVGFGREKTVFIDPFSGNVLGEGSSLRGFFRGVENFHRRLALGPLGENITRIGASSFFVLLVSGLYLWLPRGRWKRDGLRAAALPRFDLRGKARDWNWHTVTGIWCSPLILIVTLTGLIMAYPWATNLLYRAAGDEPPPRPAPRENAAAQGDKTSRQGHAPSAAFNVPGLDKLCAVAMRQIPGWQSITARFSPSSHGTIAFQIDEGDGMRPDSRSQLTLNSKSGEVVRWEPFQSYSPGRKLRMWVRAIHTGEGGGIPGQFLAVLASCGAIMLIWTGLSLAWRRFFSSFCKKRMADIPLSPPAGGAAVD